MRRNSDPFDQFTVSMRDRSERSSATALGTGNRRMSLILKVIIWKLLFCVPLIAFQESEKDRSRLTINVLRDSKLKERRLEIYSILNGLRLPGIGRYIAKHSWHDAAAANIIGMQNRTRPNDIQT